jgi:hypothetical protein
MSKSYIGYAIPPFNVAFTEERLERFRTTVAPLGETFVPCALAAVNIEPFLAIPGGQLPPGGDMSVASEATWTFGRPASVGDTLQLESVIADHYRCGSRELVDIETEARAESGERVFAVTVSLSWKGAKERASLIAERPRPRPLADIAAPAHPAWSVPLDRESVRCLFKHWPNADTNPHVSIEAARRYGLSELLVSAPQLACLIAAGTFKSDPPQNSTLRLRYLRPVLARESIAISSVPCNERSVAVGLWSKQLEGPALCVQGEFLPSWESE